MSRARVEEGGAIKSSKWVPTWSWAEPSHFSCRALPLSLADRQLNRFRRHRSGESNPLFLFQLFQSTFAINNGHLTFVSPIFLLTHFISITVYHTFFQLLQFIYFLYGIISSLAFSVPYYVILVIYHSPTGSLLSIYVSYLTL